MWTLLRSREGILVPDFRGGICITIGSCFIWQIAREGYFRQGGGGHKISRLGVVGPFCPPNETMSTDCTGYVDIRVSTFRGSIV